MFMVYNDSFGDMVFLIGGLVVQLGVEFGFEIVYDLFMDCDLELVVVVVDQDGVCFEVYLIDYQFLDVYLCLVQLGFVF